MCKSCFTNQEINEEVQKIRNKYGLKNRQVSTELVKNFVSWRGGYVLDKFVYEGSDINFQINCGKHIFSTNWESLLNGRYCPYCSKKKIDEKDVRKFIENKGGILPANWKYINNSVKFKIICKDCSNEFEMHWGNIHTGYWCPYWIPEDKWIEEIKSQHNNFINTYK